MLAALVLGLINGLSYAVVAIGLVLVFKASRFVNFAHAQLGVMSVLFLAKAVLDWGWNWYVALLAALLLGAALGAAVELLVIRRLANQSRMVLLIATIGVAQVLQSLTFVRWFQPTPTKLRAEGYPLPFHASVEFDSLVLGSQHILALVAIPALVIVLGVFLRYTMTGKAIRAISCNRDAARLAGISVDRVSSLVWILAGLLSAVTAILQAPNQPTLDVQSLGPNLLLRALGAAVFAGFTRLPTAFAAGIALGLIEGATLHLSSNGSTTEIVMFGVILLGLMLRGRTIGQAVRAGEDGLGIDERPLRIPENIKSLAIVRHQRKALMIGSLLLGVLAPQLPMFRPADKTFILALVLVMALISVSLTILVAWTGQISLGHFAMAGVGAYAAARLAPEGWSLPSIVVVAGFLGAAIAVAIGLPAVRLRGLTLAVTTLGFAVVAPSWLFLQSWFKPDQMSIAPLDLPGFGPLDSQRSVYYTGLVILTLALLGAASLRRSNSGRLLIAVRDNESAARSLGHNVTAVRLSAFALSGFVASTAGVLWVAATRTVGPTFFPPDLSLLVLAVVVIGGLGSLPGAVIGAVLIFGVPQLCGDLVRDVFPSAAAFHYFVAGSALLLTLLANPGGISLAIRRSWERLLHRIAAERKDALPAPSTAAEPLLEVKQIYVSFGGITAVDGASITVGRGEIVGLIGTNGAGKTTLLNAISGVIRPHAGSILMLGQEVVFLPQHERAQLGMARSYQDAQLFAGLTLRETLQLAHDRPGQIGMLAALGGLPGSRAAERRTRLAADEVIRQVHLEPWADTLVGDLSTGTRRICDLAVQTAARPLLLILDEPTAGVAQRESEAFAPLLRRIRDEIGCSILVVEHDMPLLLEVADRIYCLEGGRVIAEGAPEQIQHDARVIASYLGTDPVAVQRSGQPSDRANPHGQNAMSQTKEI